MSVTQKIKNNISEKGFWPALRSFLLHRLGRQTSSPILDIYYSQPLDENKILLLGLGKSVRGSLQYILDVLNHDPQYSHFQMYIRASEETAEVIRTFARSNGWKQVHPVVDIKEYEYHMETAKYLLTETYFPNQWIRRDGQVSVNIWHGTPLKRLGLEKMTLHKYCDGVTQKNFINADYLLYPNEFTRDIMLKSYRVSGLMHGQAVMCGYPRTSGLCDRTDVQQIREKLAPGGETFYAYMPTWKEYLPVEEMITFSKELLDYLDANMQDNQLLYVNLHHKVSAQLDYSSYHRVRKFPADMDSYRLLAASDGLITDYSSVFFDYLASRRNIILYVPDLEDYEEKRGTYMDVRTLPFHQVRTPAAVLDAMNRGKTYDDTEAYNKFCAFEHESNAAVLCRIFLNDLSGLSPEEITGDSRRKILFYSDDPAEGNGNNMYLDCAQCCSRTEYDLYLSGFEPLIMEDREHAAPALEKINRQNVIGLSRQLRFSSKGQKAKAAWEAGNCSLQEAMKILKRDYQTDFRMSYGVSPFDAAVIWAAKDADQLLMLSSAPCSVMVVLTQMLVSSMESGDRMMKDAVRYLAQTGTPFASGSQELTERALKQVAELEGIIRSFRNPSGINQLIADL